MAKKFLYISILNSKIRKILFVVIVIVSRNAYSQNLDFNYKIKSQAAEIYKIQKEGRMSTNQWSIYEKDDFAVTIIDNYRGIPGGIKRCKEKVWVKVDISYGVKFENVTNLNVSLKVDVEPADGENDYRVYDETGFIPFYSLELYDKSNSGCKAKIWIPKDIRYLNNEKIKDWIWKPEEIIFKWHVEGTLEQDLVLETTGSKSVSQGYNEEFDITVDFVDHPDYKGGTMSDVSLLSPPYDDYDDNEYIETTLVSGPEDPPVDETKYIVTLQGRELIPPTAAIDAPAEVTVGETDIIINASEELQKMPELEYILDGKEAVSVELSETEEERTWAGHLNKFLL